MFIQMLKNQRVTFVSDKNQAERVSPFYMWHNFNSGCYVVSKQLCEGCESSPVAAGLTKEEAEACVMFKANEWIYNNIQGAK